MLNLVKSYLIFSSVFFSILVIIFSIDFLVEKKIFFHFNENISSDSLMINYLNEFFYKITCLIFFGKKFAEKIKSIEKL